MEFRSGRKCTVTRSPQLKVKKSAAKKRLTYDVPLASSALRTTAASEVQPKPNGVIANSKRMNEDLRKVISELLSSGCKAYAVADSTNAAYDNNILEDCKRKIETLLNNKYSRIGYIFKARFKTIQGIKLTDWDGDGLLLKIGRKHRNTCEGPNGTILFSQVLQCLFTGRNTYQKKFTRTKPDMKFRPLLLVGDSANFFSKIKDILVETLKIYISALSPAIGEELKVFCGRCFLISFIQKGLDFNDSMTLASKYERNYEGEPKEYDYECQIPLVYFKEFISHSTLEQVTNANILMIWYQFFRSFGGLLPINSDFPLTEISFPNFRFMSQGEITLVNPSLELCFEVLEALTKFAEKGSRRIFRQY